jgi:cellulose biosynthesis protein BcsQ
MGGTGKTKHAIQTANCLGAAGHPVLFIDMDFNDSATKFYITNMTEEGAVTKNHF